MPVVDVRPVGVGVDDPLVAMPMAMPGGGLLALVGVQMMSVIVAVGVHVFGRLVHVDVLVPAQEQENDR